MKRPLRVARFTPIENGGDRTKLRTTEIGGRDVDDPDRRHKFHQAVSMHSLQCYLKALRATAIS